MKIIYNNYTDVILTDNNGVEYKFEGGELNGNKRYVYMTTRFMNTDVSFGWTGSARLQSIKGANIETGEELPGIVLQQYDNIILKDIKFQKSDTDAIDIIYTFKRKSK